LCLTLALARGGVLLLGHAIIDDPVHEVLLVSHSLGLSTQGVFQNVLLVDVERLELVGVYDVLGSMLQKFVSGDTCLQGDMIFVLNVQLLESHSLGRSKEHVFHLVEVLVLILKYFGFGGLRLRLLLESPIVRLSRASFVGYAGCHLPCWCLVAADRSRLLTLTAGSGQSILLVYVYAARVIRVFGRRAHAIYCPLLVGL